MKITTIIFDLSEVYLRGFFGMHELLSARLGISLQPNDIQPDELKDFFAGRISEDDLWKSFITKYAWPLTVDELKRMVRSNFREIEGTRRIIEELKRQGFRLGLLSVHGKEWVEHLEKEFDYHRLFDSVLYSFQAEVSKPDIRAYSLMLERLGCKPEETLFIDDWDRNLPPAQALGIRTIAFRSPQQLRAELIHMGILANGK